MADQTETAAFVYVAPAAAHAFAKALIAAYGVPDADAETVARCLVQADLRGVDTHGLMRLPGYLNRVRLGLTNKTPKLEAKPVGTAGATRRYDAAAESPIVAARSPTCRWKPPRPASRRSPCPISRSITTVRNVPPATQGRSSDKLRFKRGTP